jgi:hypothetical protein
MATLALEGGRQDKLRPGDILGALCGDVGLAGTEVGAIQVGVTRSYIAIARARVGDALAAGAVGYLLKDCEPADLLAAEAHALTLLHAHGEAHAAPRLLDAANRRFLETPRYDRVGPHGRRGVVSLRALHDAFGGPDAHLWTAAAANLRARDLIDDATLRSIRLRHAFGRLIGNTDMHFGNLAFWFDDSLPFRLAPAYDQLPMLWAPASGNATPTPDFAPTLPLPAEREIWQEAAAWADEFWQRVTADPRVSRPFAAVATAALATVRRLRAVA